jgi:hypothetical protein
MQNSYVYFSVRVFLGAVPFFKKNICMPTAGEDGYMVKNYWFSYKLSCSPRFASVLSGNADH